MHSPPGGFGPPPGGGYQGPPGGGRGPGLGPGAAHPAHKPITGSAETMALHAMTIDPRTGLPKGEKPPASTAAVLSIVCGILLCLGPITGLTAIIAGIVAIAQARKRPTAVGGAGLGAFGIALGVINLVLSLVALVHYAISSGS